MRKNVLIPVIALLIMAQGLTGCKKSDEIQEETVVEAARDYTKTEDGYVVRKGKKIALGTMGVIETLNDEVAVIVTIDNEKLVIDIDTFNEKRIDPLKEKDNVLISYYKMTENEDGTFTPELAALSYQIVDASESYQGY